MCQVVRSCIVTSVEKDDTRGEPSYAGDGSVSGHGRSGRGIAWLDSGEVKLENHDPVTLSLLDMVHREILYPSSTWELDEALIAEMKQ